MVIEMEKEKGKIQKRSEKVESEILNLMTHFHMVFGKERTIRPSSEFSCRHSIGEFIDQVFLTGKYQRNRNINEKIIIYIIHVHPTNLAP